MYYTQVFDYIKLVYSGAGRTGLDGSQNQGLSHTQTGTTVQPTIGGMPTYSLITTCCATRDEQRQTLAREMLACAQADIRDALFLIERESYRNALILMLQCAEKSFKAIMLHIDANSIDGYHASGFGQDRAIGYAHELTVLRGALMTERIQDRLLAASLLSSIDCNMASIVAVMDDEYIYNNLRYPRPRRLDVTVPVCERPSVEIVQAFVGIVEIGKACIQLIPFTPGACD